MSHISKISRDVISVENSACIFFNTQMQKNPQITPNFEKEKLSVSLQKINTHAHTQIENKPMSFTLVVPSIGLPHDETKVPSAPESPAITPLMHNKP